MNIGLDIPLSQTPNGFIRLARLMDRAGFRYLWIVDNALWGRDTFMYLGLAARVTERIRLGPGATHPAIRHPGVIANAMATLDELSRGRAALGISSGGLPVTELGCSPATLKVMRETLRSVRELLHGATVTSAPHETVKFREARLHVPLGTPVRTFLGASGPRFLRLGGEAADGVFMNVGAHPACAAEAEKLVAEGERSTGRPLGSVERRLWLYCAVESNKRKAIALCRRGIGILLGRYPRYGELLGMPSPTLERIAEEVRTRPDQSSPSTPDDVVDALALAGTPQEVTQRLGELFDRGVAGVDLYVLSPQLSRAVRALAQALPLRA